MIRPFTAMCCALAAGAVLYTYQSKHEVQLLDRQIEKTLADTAALRDQSRGLKAEFTLRENPERLRTFADQYLSLKPMLPTQFTTLAELDAHLPAPRAMAPATGTTDTTEEPAEVPVASAPQATDAPADTEVATEELPIPPLPVLPPPVALAANQAPAAPKPAPPRPPVVQAAMPVQAPPIQVAPIQMPPLQAQAVRTPAPPAQARPQPAPMPAPQPVQGGSLLGMAHGGSFAPVPRPMPVNATQWSNGN